MFVHHPGFTLGYRIEHLGKTIVYISDNEPFDPSMPAEAENSEASVLERFTSYPGDPNNRIVEFCKNADILIHDATYTPEEYAERKGWGHSDFPFAMRIAHAAHVKHLLLFHHDPSHTDEMLDALGRRCQQEIENQKYRFTCEMSVENATWKV
jgi:ribonuclease BN (tRNA processing enzyme)